MDKFRGPHNVIHTGDDAPVAIGKTKNGRTVAVWKQGLFRKHSGYAMDEDVYAEVMSNHPDLLYLVDHTDLSIHKVDIEELKTPESILVSNLNDANNVGELLCDGGGPLFESMVDAKVEPQSDTDRPQRLVPQRVCTKVGDIPKDERIFDYLFSNYRG